MQHMRRTEVLEFSAFPVSIRARVDAAMTPMIAPLLKGWSISPSGNSEVLPELEILSDSDGRMTIRGPYVGQEYSLADPVDGVCSFIAEVLKVQANESSAEMCVHSAAAVFCDRAVLFPAAFRAGKSTLSAVLASRGLRIIGDDAVFISPIHQTAVSSGISPRMRLPLPEDLANPTKEFIERSMCLAGKRYGYLSMPGKGLLTNGEPVPIGAFVYLKRNPDGAATLSEAPKAEALRTLIWQNFARQMPAGRILACLSNLVASRPTLELQYSKAEDAADLLESRFSVWPEESVSESNDSLLFADYRSSIDDPRWHAKPNIVEHSLDAGHFIADEDSGRIFHLNITAGAIWRMLSVGEDTKVVTSLLSEAFPEIDSKLIAEDVDSLVQSFSENGLLMPTERSG